MTLKHFLKRQNRSKNKIRKITVKSRNVVKSACFWHVLCYISAIFEDIDLKFCTHIHEILPSKICYVFLKILVWGKLFRKEKKLDLFLKIFQNFQNFENPRQQFCSHTNSTSFYISQLIVALKTAPVAAIPVNPFCWSKSAKHDVTLTSLTADLLWPGS